MPLTMPSTAWSSGASSKTMLAALPPSSRVSFLPEPARVRWICLPTSVEPVKATLSTPAWPTSVAPVAPAPVRMFTTPSGSSACWRIWPRRSAVSARHARPDLAVGGAGGPHGRLDVLAAGLGDLGEDLLGGRVDGLEVPVGGGRDPAAADQQAVVGADLDVVGGLGRRRVPEVEAGRGPLRPSFQLLRHAGRLRLGRRVPRSG